MQQLHNGVIVNVGNSSASNDPKQIPNDANDQLMKGAAALAAGRTLGLSEEEVLAAVSRQARADMRQYAPAGLAGTGTSFIDAQNDVIRRTQQAQAALGQQGELTMPYFVSEFKEGFMQPGSGSGGKLETLNPDTEQTKQVADRNYISNEDQVRIESTARARERYDERRRSKGRFKMGPPLSATEDTGSPDREFGRLDMETGDRRVQEVGTAPVTRAFAEEGMRRQQAAVQALGEAERARLSGSGPQRRLNDEKAAVEAEALRRSEMTSGTLPSAPIVVNRRGEMSVRPNTAAGFTTATEVDGTYVDPRTGEPVSVNEPATDVFAGSNTPNTGQQLNAPSTRSATEFVAKQIDTGTSPYPQVAIQEQFDLLNQQIDQTSQNSKRLGGLRTSIPGRIDSLDSFQKATDAIIQLAAERGVALGSTSEAGRTVSNEPGISEALDAIGIKGVKQKERIALALNSRLPGRSVVFDPDFERYGADALPLGGSSLGLKDLRYLTSDQPVGKAIRTALRDGTYQEAPPDLNLDDEGIRMHGADLFIHGVRQGDGYPKVTKASGSASDVPAIHRIRRIESAMGKQPGSVARAAASLRARGNPNPTFGDVMDLMESVYESQVAAGKIRKPIDEDNLAKTIDRNVGALQRFDAAEEEQAMARLLAGPLAPGRPERPEPSPEAPYFKPDNVMTEGAQRALQEERSKNRGPGAIPNDPEMSELIRIARRMR